MACDLTERNRDLECKEHVGGLKNVYFVNYTDTVPTMNASTRVVASVTGTKYKYELKGNSSFTQNVQASRENGTVAYEQVLELTLPKLTVADHKEIKLISFGRPRVIVEDYNGNYFLVGREHGAEVTGGTVVTGAAMGDLSGYTLTLTAMERFPANFVTSIA